MDLAAFRTAFYNDSGKATTDPYFTTGVVDGFINRALRRISTERDWPWNSATDTSISTVAGTATVATPSGWYKTRNITIDNYEPLALAPLASIRAQNTTARGNPAYYTVQGDQIILRPVPDAAYTLIHDYYRTETTLTLSTDTPRLPLAYHDAVVDLALHYACLKEGELERAKQYFAQYSDALRAMKNDVRRASGPVVVRVRPGYEE